MKRLILTLITAFILISLVHAAIPSEQAADVASTYARKGELTQPASSLVGIDLKTYWLVYYVPENNPSGKNAIAVIDSDDGVLVFDEKILFKAYAFDLRRSKVEDFFTKNDNLKLDRIRDAVDFSSKSQDQAEETITDLADKLQDKNVNFATVQNSLAGLRSSTELLGSKVDMATEQQKLFYTGDYSYKGLNGFISSYTSLFDAYDKFLESSQNYQKSVINKSKELTDKGIAASDFDASLKSAYKVGLENFLTKSALSGAKSQFVLISDKESDKQVNDSVKSFLYRKASVDSKKTFDEMSLVVTPILDSKKEVEQCVSVKKLQTAYDSAKVALDKGVFDDVFKYSSEAKLDASSVQGKFDKCVADRQKANEKANSTVAKKEDNTMLYVGVIAAVVILYLISQFMKKKKEVEEMGAHDDSHSGSSLFESHAEHH